MRINGTAARRFASAGQQRTLVLALKMAELQLVGELCGEPPLLLLDDVLAELDPTRQLALLEACWRKPSMPCQCNASRRI
jgi:DNA replication and repair protein RecF